MSEIKVADQFETFTQKREASGTLAIMRKGKTFKDIENELAQRYGEARCVASGPNYAIFTYGAQSLRITINAR
jgi:hypothetical protein